MPKTIEHRPKRYVAKKKSRGPECAIPGCPNRAQSGDSPHCSVHQPKLPMFDRSAVGRHVPVGEKNVYRSPKKSVRRVF
jgi:hypothetical protein